MNIVIVLPWPDRKLSPNASARHWRAKAGPQHEAHKAAFMLTRAAMIANDDMTISRKARVKMTIVARPPNAARRDLDNILAALKHALDGVADALDYDDAQIDELRVVRGEVVHGGEVIVKIYC